MGNVLDGADRLQRRKAPLGVPIAVVYKFFDDQSNYLAAIITYYAFVAIFPLLLLASSIFGFFLQGNPDLEERLLNSTLAQFPIIGEQLGSPEGLQGSAIAIIVGGAAALYGSLGLGQAIQNAMNIAWSVPRNSRPNPVLLRVKSLLLLMTAGVSVIAVSIIGAIGSSTTVLGHDLASALRWLITLVTVLLVGGVLSLLFRFTVSRRLTFLEAAPGAFVVAVLWQGLQAIGTFYATHALTGPSTLNKTFGLVLGLIGIVYIASVMALIGIQVNVVLVRHLWPRALLTPFTDAVELTEADRRAYTGYARAQRHKGFETVDVSFEGHPDVPQEPAAPGDTGSHPIPSPEAERT